MTDETIAHRPIRFARNGRVPPAPYIGEEEKSDNPDTGKKSNSCNKEDVDDDIHRKGGRYSHTLCPVRQCKYTPITDRCDNDGDVNDQGISESDTKSKSPCNRNRHCNIKGNNPVKTRWPGDDPKYRTESQKEKTECCKQPRIDHKFHYRVDDVDLSMLPIGRFVPD